jgi:hypothetical protein
MKFCDLCGKQLGMFTLKHRHKIDDNKIKILCHDCHVKKGKEMEDERNREMNELIKVDAQLKLEKKFAAKVVKAINYNYVSFRREGDVRGVEVRDYTSQDSIFTINILGNYHYGMHDLRYTYENMMNHKRLGCKMCLGEIIVGLSKEKQIYEYEKIDLIFWGEKYDIYGRGTWMRYASFSLVPSTLKKMNLANLKSFQVIQVFDYQIEDFPNGLD